MVAINPGSVAINPGWSVIIVANNPGLKMRWLQVWAFIIAGCYSYGALVAPPDWIDIPLDIALARNIKEFTNIFLKENNPQMDRKNLTWLNNYLEYYVNDVREMLELQKQKVSSNADIILNGLESIDNMVNRIIDDFKNRNKFN